MLALTPQFGVHVKPIFARAGTSLDRVGLWITSAVGTMWCAIAFAALALAGLPDALRSGAFVPWLAQSFLQLVLLSIIMVGQRLQAAGTEQLIRETHEHSAEAIADLTLIADALHVHLTGESHPAAGDNQ